ncbi:unnamed protein product [Closterium sp. NIES-64]|nr:unnamed protein product [Closterium sp. NIES-64]
MPLPSHHMPLECPPLTCPLLPSHAPHMPLPPLTCPSAHMPLTCPSPHVPLDSAPSSSIIHVISPTPSPAAAPTACPSATAPAASPSTAATAAAAAAATPAVAAAAWPARVGLLSRVQCVYEAAGAPPSRRPRPAQGSRVFGRGDIKIVKRRDLAEVGGRVGEEKHL